MNVCFYVCVKDLLTIPKTAFPGITNNDVRHLSERHSFLFTSRCRCLYPSCLPLLILSPFFVSFQMPVPTILVVGATGRSGQAIIRAAAASSRRPVVYGFARSPEKMAEDDRKMCKAMIRGDARSPDELAQAIEETDADFVIMCVGIPDSLKPSDIREATAIALVAALKQSDRLRHVRVAIISALGAGGSKIRLGFGIGSVVQFILRNGLRDHDMQEATLQSAFSAENGLDKRLLIVRPTGLIDSAPRKYGVYILNDRQRSPTFSVHRDDMAEWLIERIVGDQESFGGIVAITGVRK